MWLLKNNKEYKNKTIRGYIIAIDVNSGWYKTFEVEPNGTLSNIAIAKANTLANALQTNKCPDGEVQLYCSRCPFKADCEAISKGTDKQLPFEIKSIIGRLKQLQATEKEIKKCKDTVKSFMVATNTSIAKSDTVTVSLKENSGDNYSVDVNKLRVEQPDIYAKYRVPAKKYSYVQII
jgi:CRISPR-associated exonuclease Cas4